MDQNMQIMGNNQEQVTHQSPSFPLAVFRDDFDAFIGNSYQTHWHYELELVIVLSGGVRFFLDKTVYDVKAGNGLFIGSQVLHSAEQLEPHSVSVNILFPDKILNHMFHDTSFYRYTAKVSGWAHQYMLLDTNIPEHHEILESLRAYETAFLSENKELLQAEALLHIWRYLPSVCKNFVPDEDTLPGSTDKIRQERMREMITYIQNNYMHHITAASIAAAANVSRSECFRCFSLFNETSPVDYLNKYRLNMAAKSLLEGDDSVSDISYACGFSSISYFSKTFRENYGMSPLSFRKSRHSLAEQQIE